MKKRILSLLLVLCFIISIMPMGVSAVTAFEGYCGENLVWKLSSDGVLTISGSGKMYDFGCGDTPWILYKTNIKTKTIIVKNGVTSIGDYAFDFGSQVTSVTLPDTVETIGTYAFGGCSIKGIDLPKNLKSIGESAFVSTKIKSIKLPSKLKTIGARAFCGTPLKEITIPASVTEIGNEQGSPFRGLDTLKKIKVSSKNKHYCDVDGVLFNKDKTELLQYPLAKSGSAYKIPASVDIIGDCAFSGTALKKIIIPNGVKKIGFNSFYYVKKLKEIDIPKSVKSIGWDAFGACYKLEKINVSKDNKYYSSKDGVLFNKDKTELIRYPVGKKTREYSVPKTVTYIHWKAFALNDYLFKLTFPESLKEIETYITQYCDSLMMVIFKGDAPQCKNPFYAFSDDGTAVYYPKNNKTWTKEIIDAFEGGEDGHASLTSYDSKIKAPTVTASNNYNSGLIKLKWDAVEGAKTYYIYRSESEYGTYWLLESTKKTSFTDNANVLFAGGKAKPGKKFYYKVVAMSEESQSLFSETVARTCNLPRVEVKVKNSSTGKVKLSWKTVSGAKEYVVYRATKEKGTYKKIATTKKTKTSFTDSTAKVGKRYYYKVVAVHKNSKANSAKSKVVSGKRK